jgi:nitroreductase
MDAIQAIHNRQGVLVYRPDPVPRELVEIVLRAACAVPSPANTQPWEAVNPFNSYRQP